jgi:glucose dehydrogenase
VRSFHDGAFGHYVLPVIADAAISAALVAGCGGSDDSADASTALDWRFYGNDPGGMRVADVDQVNVANVAQLAPAWILHTNVANDHTPLEAQPIAVDGTVYVSSPHDHVFAADASSGDIRWTYSPTMPVLSELAICCGQTSRGVAVGGGKVFIGQLDAKLVALDAKTGGIAWHIQVAGPGEKWTVTMAPQYVDGKVFVGASGGEFMKRGFIDACDAGSGQRLWRFNTVPGPREPGNETWSGDSWQTMPSAAVSRGAQIDRCRRPLFHGSRRQHVPPGCRARWHRTRSGSGSPSSPATCRNRSGVGTVTRGGRPNRPNDARPGARSSTLPSPPGSPPAAARTRP